MSPLELAELVRHELIDGNSGDSDMLDAVIERQVRRNCPLLSPNDHERLLSAVRAELTGLGPLDELMADAEVSEIMVNAGEVWVERSGRLLKAGRLGAGRAEAAVERILAPLGRRIDRLHPIVDARLADGSRLCAIVPPLAVDGICLSIRRFRTRRIELAEFASPPEVALLEALVAGRCNLVVIGATSSGKTSLLNALAGMVDGGERIVTVEDVAELRLANEHVVRLECRPATVDGAGEVSPRDLVRAALRLRPDRLVVGEVRGAEAADMLQALSTGHDGSMSTCHANSPLDALRRIELMALQAAESAPLVALREQVHASIDTVVHVGRGPSGVRQVMEIAELHETPDGPARLRSLASGGRVLAAPTRFRR